MSKKVELPGADALFGGTPTQRPEAERTEKRTPAAPTRRNARKRVNTQTRKHVSKQAGEPPASSPSASAVQEKATLKPIKYTFYFQPETLEQLDEAWFRLRRERRVKVTKWQIVDAAVRAALEDFDALERLLGG